MSLAEFAGPYMMAGSSTEGPERPTLIERVIGAVPIPYALGCLLFASVLGVPGFLLARYVDTGSADVALSMFGPLLFHNVGTYVLANFGLTLYALAGTRYMRTRVVSTEPAMAALTPDGEEALHRSFGPLTRWWPPFAVGAIVFVVSYVALPDQMSGVTAPVELVLRAVSYPFTYLAYGTFVWVYVTAVRGLHRFGGEPLRLRSHYEDRFLGLKPFGSLSLSIAGVYFLGMSLVFFSFLIVPPPLLVLLGFLIFGGVVLFFLPLNAMHGRMRAEKRRARDDLTHHFRRVEEILTRRPEDGPAVTTDEVHRLMALDIAERRVTVISEWPFDLRTLSWLGAIVLSVLAAVITRYAFTVLP